VLHTGLHLLSFAFPLPANIIGELLGVPPESLRTLHESPELAVEELLPYDSRCSSCPA
jgi:cytochrome P450